MIKGTVLLWGWVTVSVGVHGRDIKMQAVAAGFRVQVMVGSL